MRAVVQRVKRAQVTVDGRVVGKIGRGLCVFLGVARGDTAEDARYLAHKVAELRIFPDEAGRFNRGPKETGAAVLAVSQFTLLGDGRRGNRPSFTEAAPPEEARALYEEFVAALRAEGLPVATGEFQAHMLVESANDGPVTLLFDSRKAF
ncbi:MAG: D-aminoacyl-tRNA deacylase [Bacillota bacterium]|nr:D-aminoacyl-tRNA deacylase [Bacillota bacterium]